MMNGINMGSVLELYEDELQSLRAKLKKLESDIDKEPNPAIRIILEKERKLYLSKIIDLESKIREIKTQLAQQSSIRRTEEPIELLKSDLMPIEVIEEPEPAVLEISDISYEPKCIDFTAPSPVIEDDLEP